MSDDRHELVRLDEEVDPQWFWRCSCSWQHTNSTEEAARKAHAGHGRRAESIRTVSDWMEGRGQPRIGPASSLDSMIDVIAELIRTLTDAGSLDE